MKLISIGAFTIFFIHIDFYIHKIRATFIHCKLLNILYFIIYALIISNIILEYNKLNIIKLYIGYIWIYRRYIIEESIIYNIYIILLYIDYVQYITGCLIKDNIHE